MLRRPLVLLLLMTLIAPSLACHRRFKKFVAQSEAVELAVTVPGRPSVDLVEDDGATRTQLGAVVQAATSIAGAVEGAKVQRRIEGLMSPDNVQDMASQGALAELETRAPFGLAEGRSDGLLELTLTNYGIIQEGGGPVFFVDYSARVYDATQRRVYRHLTSCRDREFFTGYRAVNLAGTIATIVYLQDMSDEELRRKLDEAIDRCTSRVFSNMRRHAG